MVDNSAILINDSEVLDMLDNLIGSIKDARPAFQSLGRFVKNRALLGFKGGVNPYGKPWDSISHRDGQPLRDTGILSRSLHYEATVDELEVGTNINYARVHQDGFSGVVSIPAHVRTITQAFGKKLKGGPLQVNVKAHNKKMEIAQRQFLPDEAGGLPGSWDTPITDILHRHIEQGIGQ